MNKRQLQKLGYPAGMLGNLAKAAAATARGMGWSAAEIFRVLFDVRREPGNFTEDPVFGELARAIQRVGVRPPPRAETDYDRAEVLDYPVWGDEIDEQAHQQMRNACRLPISVAGALMPDAHVGYGLPIGGVLATDNAVIPYAVGVDIACRMMMTAFELPPERLDDDARRFERILEEQTRFGVGAKWKPCREHPVMDEDWNVTPVTAGLKNLARQQLGTSGSGNHFVEFGELTVLVPVKGLAPGRYLAVVSHSGSRGPGNKTATHYSRWAMSRHGKMPKELRHLAWLDMNGDGDEYWAAMQLMGYYASANHHVIHRQIVSAVGLPPALQVENHHNFAWKEIHDGREVVVHRKGATPADAGVLGIIPGSMASPAYLVEGLGNETSLRSAAHGAGRHMSRSEAKRTFHWSEVRPYLAERGVTLLSAGLDEVPWVYKDIEQVMAAQSDLVRPIARFNPRIVKMAPSGERPED